MMTVRAVEKGTGRVRTGRIGGGSGGGVAPAFQADFTSLSALPAGVLFSRASNGMVYDSTGKLTWAPNNLLTQSNTFTDAAWTKDQGGTISATGIADPFGGTAASTFTASGGANGRLYQNATPALFNTTNGLSTVWLRRRTGTGQVSMFNSNAGSLPVTITGAWAQYTLVVAGGPNGFAGIMLATNGDAVDIYAPTLSCVTYETTPRTVDQVITTSAAYYGPRFDYDPNTLTAKGLLIEEQRTNVLVGSNNFSGASWGTDAATLAQNTTGPDGVANSAWTITALGGVSDVYQPVSFSGDSAFSISAEAATAGSWLWIETYASATRKTTWFNLSTGTVGTVNSTMQGSPTFNHVSAAAKNLGNGWWRFSVVNSGGTPAEYAIFGLTDADATKSATNGSSCKIFGSQAEAGSFPTSYIPTTSAAVTRSADIAQLTGAADVLLQAAAASVVLEANLEGVSNSSRLLGQNDGNGFTPLFVLNSTTLGAYDGNSVTTPVGGGVSFAGNVIRSGVAWDVANTAIVSNGGTAATMAHGFSLPAGTYLFSNIAANSFTSGWLSKLAIYSSRLSNADLQTKSVVGASF